MDRDFTAIHVLRVSIIVSCVNLSGNVCRGTTVMNGLLLKLSSRRTNVVHKRAGQPKRAGHFSKVNLLQSTFYNTTTINYRLQNTEILFRLVAIRCICNFYCAAASVVASLSTTSAAPLSAHPL
jgi:hypothetical protein